MLPANTKTDKSSHGVVALAGASGFLVSELSRAHSLKGCKVALLVQDLDGVECLRVAEAVQNFSEGIVVNVQGDEPLLFPKHIEMTMRPIQYSRSECGKPAQPDSLKIDVDGIEHLVLWGGHDVLSQARCVLIEINDESTDQAEEAARHLKNAYLNFIANGLTACRIPSINGGDAESDDGMWASLPR